MITKRDLLDYITSVDDMASEMFHDLRAEQKRIRSLEKRVLELEARKECTCKTTKKPTKKTEKKKVGRPKKTDK